MQKRILVLILSLAIGGSLSAQKTDADSLDYYDDLFSELDLFLDSLLAPRTLTVLNLGATATVLNYTTSNTTKLDSRRQLLLTPSLGYFHKSGFGINVSGMIAKDSAQWHPYQMLATGSYDYLKNDRFVTGVSVTRFFTKEDLPFYTSPLQNELGAYFLYRRWWLKPSITARYGWGTRTAVTERQQYITPLRLRTGVTQTSTEETVSDFSIAASLRHDFYKLDILGDRSVLRFTPQLTFASGTQKFGFNETTNSAGPLRGPNNPLLFKSESNYLDEGLEFQPLSLSLFLKAELSYHKFFIQPQVGFHYYFPATDKHFISALALNAGLVF